MRIGRVLLAIALVANIAAAPDLSSPLGVWETVDRDTGKPNGLVRLFEANGAIYGRIETIYDPVRARLICSRCRDDRHDRPYLGLDFLRGLKPDGVDVWDGGTVVDPDSGSIYRASVRLIDGGTRLVVRGYLGISLLGGSQTWTRAPG